MESIVLCALFLTLKKRRLHDAVERSKRLRARRRREFFRRQSRERLTFALLLSMAALTIQSPVRSVWVKPRSNIWWEEVVKSTFTSRDWLENFRMSNATFLYVCNEIRSSVERSDTTMRRAISVEQRVALTLWYLSTGSDFRTIGHLFGVSKSTVCIVTKQVCRAFGEDHAAKVHSFPP